MEGTTTKEIYTLTYGQDASDSIDIKNAPIMGPSDDILPKSVELEDSEIDSAMQRLQDPMDADKEISSVIDSNTAFTAAFNSIRDITKSLKLEKQVGLNNLDEMMQDEQVENDTNDKETEIGEK